MGIEDRIKALSVRAIMAGYRADDVKRMVIGMRHYAVDIDNSLRCFEQCIQKRERTNREY